MPRQRRVTPDQILAAAALEFSERGFAGARVDRIARRARVNKAMLYYHFKSKQALYRALLRETFSLAAQRMQAVAATSAPPAEKLDRAIEAFTELIRERSFAPAIMLREVAEGGAHLDPETMAVLAGVPRAFGSIVAEGIAAGEFRAVNPVFTYFSIIPTIVVFLCSAPIRREIDARHLITPDAIGAPEDFIEFLQANLRRALAPERATAGGHKR